jgi:hypothetical protein
LPLGPGTGEGVSVDFDAGQAFMAGTDLHVRDFFNIPNALLHFQHPTSEPATCSFRIRWSGPVTSRMPVTSPKGSSGQVLSNQATMTWKAMTASGFRFKSHPTPTTSAFAQLGRIANGVFAGH